MKQRELAVMGDVIAAAYRKDWKEETKKALDNKVYDNPEEMTKTWGGVPIKWKPYPNEIEKEKVNIPILLRVAADCNHLCEFLDICYDTKDLGYIRKTEDVVLKYQNFLNNLSIPQIDGRYSVAKIPRYYRMKQN